ncbi:Protein of unknown function [Gryllus bimaculatus]|nr:Protein of unknown function [Gryllus bimaculatus]
MEDGSWGRCGLGRNGCSFLEKKSLERRNRRHRSKAARRGGRGVRGAGGRGATHSPSRAQRTGPKRPSSVQRGRASATPTAPAASAASNCVCCCTQGVAMGAQRSSSEQKRRGPHTAAGIASTADKQERTQLINGRGYLRKSLKAF